MNHKISILGYFIGLLILVASVIRWYFIWYDISQAMLGVGIGILVMILAYIYNWMKETEIAIGKINKRVDAVVMWWTKQEKDEVRNIAKGNGE